MNNDKSKFEIEISSDLEYEKMVVNLVFGNTEVAILNCDRGDDQVEIKILDKYEEKIIWTFDCQTFIEALNRAVEALKRANSQE